MRRVVHTVFYGKMRAIFFRILCCAFFHIHKEDLFLFFFEAIYTTLGFETISKKKQLFIIFLVIALDGCILNFLSDLVHISDDSRHSVVVLEENKCIYNINYTTAL